MKYILWLMLTLLTGALTEISAHDTDSISAALTKKSTDDLGVIRKTVRGFSAIDTLYIEPQHYNWALMLQSTFNYDVYWLRSNAGQQMTLSPDVAMRIGPYFGWRWIFLGYTFELKNIGMGSDNKIKKEFAISLYSSQIGVDLFYRRTGNDYKIRKARFGRGDIDDKLEGVDFSGLNVGITGANVYYIFNHNRFSYPAAFAQSSCQKISCGSWMAGLGYTRHSVELDHEKLRTTVESATNQQVLLDSALMFNSMKYYDLNFSVGYAYNWVFTKNWLLCGSLSGALSYKKSSGEVEVDERNDFSLQNLNVDGICRVGLVYNNTKWYMGSSAILHTYNYYKPRFSTNNIFGSINVYIGFNFAMKKHYKRQLQQSSKQKSR